MSTEQKLSKSNTTPSLHDVTSTRKVSELRRGQMSRHSGSSSLPGDVSTSGTSSTAPTLAKKTIVSFVLDDPSGINDVIDAKAREKEEKDDWVKEHHRARYHNFFGSDFNS